MQAADMAAGFIWGGALLLLTSRAAGGRLGARRHPGIHVREGFGGGSTWPLTGFIRSLKLPQHFHGSGLATRGRFSFQTTTD